MGGSLLIGWAGLALAGPASTTCLDRMGRLDLLEGAEQSIVDTDLVQAEQNLRAMERAFSCGSAADPTLLGRMWLVEGALLTLRRDPEGARDAFRAAARTAPGVWQEDYGPELRQAYEEANRDLRGSSAISLDPPLFNYVAAVDGEPVTSFPHDVSDGLHLIQVGSTLDDIEFSRIILAFPNARSVVTTGIQEVGTRPTPPSDARSTDAEDDAPQGPGTALHVHVGVGAGLAVGRGFSPIEPTTQLTFPIETGFTLRPPGAWIRAAVTAAPLVSGVYVYNDDRGEASTPAALGAYVGGGLSTEQGDFGVLLGRQWPDRWTIRAGLASHLPVGAFPLAIEARVGLNLIQDASPAPVAEVLLALRPRLFGRSASE